jgi:hypothetical protein
MTHISIPGTAAFRSTPNFTSSNTSLNTTMHPDSYTMKNAHFNLGVMPTDLIQFSGKPSIPAQKQTEQGPILLRLRRMLGV